MKKEELFKAMEDIDDKSIEKAGSYKAVRKRPAWVKWGLPAVCAALILGVLFRYPLKTPGGGSARGSAGILAVEAQYPDPVGENMSVQEFMDSDAHLDWWDKYHDQLSNATVHQESLRDYYASIMGNLLVSKDENTVCSPLNIYTALAMLAEVSDGNTRKQILDVLDVPDIGTLRRNIKELWENNYVNTPSLKSTLANSLWLNDSVTYNQNTLKTLAEEYYASSFSGRPGTEEMNEALRAWTDRNTGELLKDQTKNMKLDPNTVLALVSTIYYKASWTDAFYPESTAQEIFHGIKGDTTVDMMHKSDTMEVYKGENFTALSLNLTDSGAMYFYLPHEGMDVNVLASDPEVFSALEFSEGGNWSYPEVHLSVPKFKVSADTDLIDTLKELGITDALDPSAADFTPVTEEEKSLYISSAEHAALVEIDENGVTGAAYTMLAMTEGAALPSDEIDFVLDRPFMFVVTGRDGSILFSGIVRNID